MNQSIGILPLAAAFVVGAVMFSLVCVSDHASTCGKTSAIFPLSPKYALVMLAGGVMAALCAVFGGIGTDMAIRFAFLTVLAAVALNDFDTMEIPDYLSMIAAGIGILSYFLLSGPSILSRIIGIFCVSVPLAVITLLIPDAFGGGDIKLMAACGIMLGWRDSLMAAFIGLLIGGVWGTFLLIAKKKQGDEHIAFGPCLCAGIAICLFFGDKAAELFLYIFDFSRFF